MRILPVFIILFITIEVLSGSKGPEVDLRIVNTEQIEASFTTSQDGELILFDRREGKWGEPGGKGIIFEAQKTSTGWSKPAIASFSGTYSDGDPFLTPDGHTLFFVSNRPCHPDGRAKDNDDIWMVRRSKNGWGTPQVVAAVSSTEMEWSPVTDEKGNLYFASAGWGTIGQGDLYVSMKKDDSYTRPTNLGRNVNSEHGEWNVGVDRAGKFLVFESSGRAEGLSASGDLYVSVCLEPGKWSRAKHLKKLSTTGSDLNVRFSPDGLGLFYATNGAAGASNMDVHWISLDDSGFTDVISGD